MRLQEFENTHNLDFSITCCKCTDVHIPKSCEVRNTSCKVDGNNLCYCYVSMHSLALTSSMNLWPFEILNKKDTLKSPENCNVTSSPETNGD